MKMKELLDNQNLYIDTHQQGDGQPVKIEFLHLHKRMNRNNFKGWEIQIYLESDQIRVDYGNGFNKDSNETKKVTNEIERIFKQPDNSKIKQFIQDLQKAIKSYHNLNDNNDSMLERWAERIAEGFGLRPKIKEKMIHESLNYRTLITKHQDEQGKKYYIKQDTDPQRIPIAASDDLNEIYNIRRY